ncbi:unnamed protein product [Candidula unifasciata]|uniref:Uncharacterized protein n=1 Tax=Candidula unifasciata TaxID=100452 RepID=A0A8S3Z494_9EUPU|nr:unnamed protein product [Candidula unifasciata]
MATFERSHLEDLCPESIGCVPPLLPHPHMSSPPYYPACVGVPPLFLQYYSPVLYTGDILRAAATTNRDLGSHQMFHNGPQFAANGVYSHGGTGRLHQLRGKTSFPWTNFGPCPQDLLDSRWLRNYFTSVLQASGQVIPAAPVLQGHFMKGFPTHSPKVVSGAKVLGTTASIKEDETDSGVIDAKSCLFNGNIGQTERQDITDLISSCSSPSSLTDDGDADAQHQLNEELVVDDPL